MAATLQDIADACGVSAQTVSRILRRQGAHSRQTRRRVLQAARQLNYRPRRQRRDAVEGDVSAPRLGVIMRGIGAASTTLCARATMREARKLGYTSYLVNLDQAGDSHHKLVTTCRELAEQGVQGVLIFGSSPIPAAARRALTAMDMPIVFVDWGPPRWPWRVIYDRQQGIAQIAGHMTQLGHRQVALLASTDAMDFLEHKVLPYRRAFSHRGIDLRLDDRWLIRPAPESGPSAYEVVRKVLAAGCHATALILPNDDAAIGALAAIREVGLSVPGDLSVVGFDDIATARFASPALTTVRCPVTAVGCAASEMIHAVIDDPATEARSVRLPFELVVRDSTGPAADRLPAPVGDVMPAR